ncbi:hypothetical protein [Kribbella sp. VKM Ac-2568]|nr:hypothetical protein [Kribbella sp. VKM Ac-2568]TCM44989.1 hypothetical protein EV648_107141 [Kribbella sp. VKM Ac-2568]
MTVTTTKLTRAAGLSAVVAGLQLISVPTVRDAQLDPAGAE